MKTNEYLQPFWDAFERFADLPAIVDNGGRVTTYRQLGELTRRIAGGLARLDLPENSLIPILLPTSMEYMAAELGVWMAGHAVVPMGTTFPESRIEYIKDHCEAPLIIDAQRLQEFSEADELRDEVTRFELDQKAILIYTSGSTGEPKGILHCFDSLCSHVHTGTLQEEHTDMVWATSSPFYFVVAMSNFPVLKGGGQLHFYTGDVLFDVRKLEDYIEKFGVTHSFISPAVLANFHNRSKSLKVVFTGSEKLVNQCSRDGYLLYNNYGMTETLGTLLHYKVDKPYESTPVGVPNKAEVQEIMLVGEDGKPVAEGEEGELVVKGCFCKCYYKDPERTAQLYQDGWLHTNDIMRQLPDGNLVYVNRKDWMVKINGQRVEPGEVEQAIQRIDGVTKAIVKGFDGKTGSQYLCGYYTSDGDITPEAIRNTLAERLPPYMVPLHIVKVDEFSYLPNGKVNRKVLLPPDTSELLSNYVAPTNEVERTLCEAFAQVLGMEQVGIDDDFFMLGGDSIKVMRLQQHCESLSLTSKMIYKGKTPRHIAALGYAALHSKELCDAVGGDIASPVFPVALSQTQMGIYAESMARQGEAAYNNPILLKIDAEIDEQKLAQAIEQVVSAHAFIKTRIEEDTEGNPVMVPSDAAYQQTIEQMSEAELEALKPQLIQPFNLQKDQLFRIRIIRTEAGLYLFSDFHHIIYDGTSMRIFMADVDRAYAGETIAPEQWTGWHVAQEEVALRQTEAYTEAKAWYEENFSGLDIENKPIPDVLGEKAVTFGSQNLPLGISNEAINVFCRRQGVTANILAIAAFAKLMGAYTNQEAALFTTIYNGRNSLRTARTIDMMVKTLPVYSCWTADTRIKDFLYDVKQQLLGAMNNDIYSFAEVATNLGINSDVLFVYQGDYLALGTVCGQPYRAIPLEKNATGSPLDFQIFNTADGPSLHVEYQKNMYSDALISQLMQCYANVLRSMLTVERLSDIELLNADQLQQLDSFNETDVDYDDTQTVVSLFRRQAKATPDAEAVVFKDKRYTYREVDEISDRIAGYIASKGLGLEDAVSIIIPRSEWMVIASFGVLKAGCTYQPLDPTYPKERLNFMVKDSGAKLLIADEALRDLVDEYQGDVLLTKDLKQLPIPEILPEEPKPESRFILLYTSGSTGVPKGCQLTHANLVCYCNWYWKYYDLKPEHRVAEYASYGFDVHQEGIYPPLTGGATVYIIPEELRLDLIALNEYFETNHISHAFMTTQVGYQFATSIENHSLLHLSCAGEKLASLNPPTAYQLHNGYGPTETTIIITIFPVKEKLVDIPIGKAMDNVRLYITDLQGHRLPIGAIGELWAAGPQVARGYLNRPEKTAEVFITNPFTREKKYAPVYRTGDIVRYLPDGNIQFVGRRDGQVKIRGFRVELKEVEAVIREFPGIKDATVQAFDAEGGGKFIAAYIVSDEQISVESLNNFILEQKPPYMVPAATMQIDAIPLNQNQKVNKRALPKPEFKKMEMEDSGNRPLNVLEQELLEIAAGVMGNREFGVATPLIYAGLTSILSIKLSVQLYKRFGIEIKSNQLTGGASIETIENVILDRWMNGNERDEVGFVEDEGLKASPLTFAQTGVYFECVKNPMNVTYSMPSMYRFDKHVVSAEFLEKVLSEFISIHPALSTHFDMTEEGVMQVPNEDQTAVISQLTMTPPEFEAYKQQFLQPFRLSSGPLYRMVIITVEDEVYLLADFHHLVMDGDSMNTFTIQLGEALRGVKLEAETLSYAKFAVDEKRFEASEGFEANKTYFAQMLADYESASEIPADIKGQEAGGLMQTVASPFDLDAVDGFAKQQGVTPASVMLAATFYTVSRYINSRNVYLSTISSGRSDVRTAGTVGMFVNTLPLGITVADTTVAEFIKASADVFKGVVEHEKYPFARIAADYGYQPHIVFEYQIGVIGKADIPGLKSREALNNESAKFKLAVHIEYRDGKPAVVLYYNDALYSRRLMDGLVGSIVAVVERMIASQDTKVRQLSIISEAQGTELSGLRQTATGDAPFKLFHECIGHFAETQPDHEALVAIDGTFTYQQMDEVTNRIANALQQKGVQERDRVALLLPRTSRLILSLFGVLKAGAAYIPCDPEYPADRIKLILEDSEARYIITTADRLDTVPADKAIDVEDLLNAQCTMHNAQSDITPDDLAYLIYTSGSTGRPKGVMLRHEGICNYLYGHPANVFANAVMTDAERILSVTTISFDAALQDIGMAYFNGKTLILATEEQANNPLELAQLITEQHINMVSGTPSRWGAWLMSPDFCKAIANLAICRAGGEKFSDQLLSQMRKATGRRAKLGNEATKARIFNCYGPTEITVASNNAELTNAEIVTVGKPQLNVKEFIVDSDGNELPVGVVGELYIGGRGVARGYNNLNEMTRERFIDYKGERIYKSGDYAKWLPDGNVVILGRTDHQIKLRGLRIELGEIENVMLKVEGMKKVVIMIRKINDREHLCAYYTADREIAPEDLKAEISKSLTQYMVPTAYLQLKEMPMTPNGKTDVKALPNPELAGVGEFVAPANDTERIFCDIFAGILKMDKVGATDSFFELGGTSLAVMQIVVQAEKTGLHVAYRDVFDNPSPRQLARLVTGEVVEDRHDEVSDYDYTAINNLLQRNTLKNFLSGERRQLGNVLLTGATGYLGIHILNELVESDAQNIYCLVRGKTIEAAEHRLNTMLYYYFAKSFAPLFGSRIHVILGDVTSDFAEGLKVDTVFNCAAIVKHFSEGTEIEDVNIGGAQRCVEYCIKTGARLIHISTASTRGIWTGEPKGDVFTEQKLYIGQYLNNKYIYSKFMAERLILDAIALHGLDGKIMRVGNLAARSTDGEFQANFSTNSFMGRIRVFNMLGCCSYAMAASKVEFSPINEVSHAIVRLATTPKECTVFHPYNNHVQFLGDVLNGLSVVTNGVRFVELDEFNEVMNRAKDDPEKASQLASLLAYADAAHGQRVTDVTRNNDYTTQVLLRLGSSFSPTSWDYVERMLTAIEGFGFFE